MKTLIQLTLILTILLTSAVHAQDIAGVATYKSQRKMEIKLDSTQFSDEMQKQMQAMMKKQFEKEYTLNFTKDESMYKVVETLDDPNPMAGGGVRVVVAGSGADDSLYKNLKEDRYANKTEVFGKPFLVKDNFRDEEWTLTKESKNIGEYTCFKATMTRTITVSTAFNSEGTDNDESAESTEEQEQLITAWYTPQIPVQNGPSNYQGLPGLILEVNDGSETILCSKIVMNPKNGVSINEPSKGKVVTSDEYRAIMEEKMKEMQERYQTNDRRRDGHNVQIRIGG
ncbi:MAG: GLPGLI family protein [Gilvibacter sp.]